jgi:hypothetical protein
MAPVTTPAKESVGRRTSKRIASSPAAKASTVSRGTLSESPRSKRSKLCKSTHPIDTVNTPIVTEVSGRGSPADPSKIATAVAVVGFAAVPSAAAPSGLSSPSKTSEGDVSLSVGAAAHSSATSGGNGSPAKPTKIAYALVNVDVASARVVAASSRASSASKTSVGDALFSVSAAATASSTSGGQVSTMKSPSATTAAAPAAASGGASDDDEGSIQKKKKDEEDKECYCRSHLHQH